MIGDVGSASALLHQLAQRQRSPSPEGLWYYVRAREGHLHPGKKRSALTPPERNDSRLEDSQGDSGLLGNTMLGLFNPRSKLCCEQEG